MNKKFMMLTMMMFASWQVMGMHPEGNKGMLIEVSKPKGAEPLNSFYYRNRAAISDSVANLSSSKTAQQQTQYFNDGTYTITYNDTTGSVGGKPRMETYNAKGEKIIDINGGSVKPKVVEINDLSLNAPTQSPLSSTASAVYRAPSQVASYLYNLLPNLRTPQAQSALAQTVEKEINAAQESISEKDTQILRNLYTQWFSSLNPNMSLPSFTKSFERFVNWGKKFFKNLNREAPVDETWIETTDMSPKTVKAESTPIDATDPQLPKAVQERVRIAQQLAKKLYSESLNLTPSEEASLNGGSLGI